MISVIPTVRDSMIRSAATLFRQRGMTATSFRQVVDHSGAPRGSIYHHFPAGKAQLVEATVRWVGGGVHRLVERRGADGDAVAALAAFIGAWRSGLDQSGCTAGCPVAAVAVEAGPEQDALSRAAADQFGLWEASFSRSLRRAGVGRAEARDLATLVVAGVEGAIVLSRAERSLAPFDRAARALETTVRSALPG